MRALERHGKIAEVENEVGSLATRSTVLGGKGDKEKAFERMLALVKEPWLNLATILQSRKVPGRVTEALL